MGKTSSGLLDLNRTCRAGRGTHAVANNEKRPCSHAVALLASLRYLPALNQSGATVPQGSILVVQSGSSRSLEAITSALRSDYLFRSDTRYGWLLLSPPPLVYRLHEYEVVGLLSSGASDRA